MSKLTNERTLKSYVWASIALVLTLAMLLAVSYPGLRTVAEELTDNNGGGYTSSEGSEVSKDVLKVYENGTIKLRSFEDLQKVGTGAALTTEDGTQVYDISGYAVTYALDANYMVVEDIVLPAGQKWVLPKNFTGYIAEETEDADAPTTKAEVEKAIAGAEKAAKDHPLYDEETNTILIYNPYQLVTLAQEDAAEQPVMSLDFEAATYGMGQLVSGTEGDLLTYDPANTYVISTHFNSATPELLSEKLKTLTLEEDSSEEDTGLVAMDGVKAKLAKAPAKAPSAADANIDADTGIAYDGRDWAGQVVMTYGNGSSATKYILLGSEAQLDSLDSYNKTALGGSDVDDDVYGPVYMYQEVYEAVKWSTHGVAIDYDRVLHGPYLIYPGDADLVEGVMVYNPDEVKSDYSTATAHVDASTLSLHKMANGKDITDLNSDNANATAGVKKERYVAPADDGTIDQSQNRFEGAGGYKGTGLKYKPENNYIVFRDISLSSEGSEESPSANWTPLMFYGTMYGIEETGMGIISSLDVDDFASHPRPTVSNIVVNQSANLDLNKWIGVGFFATLKESVGVEKTFTREPVIVKNIELKDVNVTNAASDMVTPSSLISTLTSAVGKVLGTVLNALLSVLSLGENKPKLDDALSDLLNAKRKDPTNFATGSFAGRVEGNVTIDHCQVTNATVTSEEKGYVGGFVGYSSGVTEYDALSNVLGNVVDELADILNLIPWLGLGDLITILLGNAVTAGKLIPTAYTQPVISNSNLTNLTGSIGSTTTTYNGGFIGNQVGTRIEHSSITDSAIDVKAKNYGGGFAGLSRDGSVEGLLNQLGIDLLNYIRPQSVLYDCAINYTANGTTTIHVQGENLLGGFIGAQTESYAVNSVLKAQSVTVNASDSYAGGFCGYSTLGWVSNLGANERGNTSLLSTVTELLTGLLSSNSSTNEMLLSLAGVSPSAIMGLAINTNTLDVKATGSYAGGILGRGDGVYLTPSSKEYLENLTFWASSEGEKTEEDEDGNQTVTLFKVTPVYKNTPEMNVTVTGLNSIVAGDSFAGGIAGAVNTANVAGLLNGTLGIGGFRGFHIDDVHIAGTDGGFTVLAGTDCAAGGIGESIGGSILSTSVDELKSVIAKSNYAGGFIGRAGPGTLVSSEGLSLNLLGLNKLANVSNLLSVGAAIHTKVDHTTVDGIDEGFFVEAQGTDDTFDFMASGFIAQANSIDVYESHVTHLQYVKANNENGITGGFVGKSATGDLASIADKDSVKTLLKADGLLSAVTYMIPIYNLCDVTYVNGGYVESAVAGGFAGDFMSGFVNEWQDQVTDSEETKATNEANRKEAEKRLWAVYNIDAVNAQYYGGGFGGKVYSGALASAGKGISILGDTALDINLADLLSVANAYVPIINYAGVKSENGFTVTAKKLKDGDATSGAAGGFAGYASGAQISTSHVYKLKHTTVTPPSDLEARQAPSYFNEESKYAVTGGRYAGGYVGLANVGSAASVSSSLGVLGDALQVSDLLSALNVVVTTIEHSNVTGGTGGFAVLATQTEALSGKVGDAGGFAGALTGAHIQDSNSYNFSYVIGEISAGGYVGNFVPGSIADAVGSLELLKGVAVIPTDLLSLGKDFVASIRNSETTCIPCGGAVRANAPSDNTVKRGMAGGYVGHNEGGQIWGWNDDAWRDENKKEKREGDLIEHNYYTGKQRECAAIRILSVYGYEFAGGFTGLMEAASTAEGSSLSLLGDLVKIDNLLGALQVAYPTEENTAVYGPLAKMDLDIWKGWVTYVGQYGGYGQEFLELVRKNEIKTQADLETAFEKYTYGYHVVAGRPAYESGTNISEGGSAGGYVGRMKSGVITNGQAHHAKKVVAMKAAGGFVGEALVGGLAEVGQVDLLHGLLNLNVGGLLSSVVDVFVPVIKNSSVQGYQTGLTVQAYGGKNMAQNIERNLSNAGGYIGNGAGVQIWGDNEKTALNKAGGCNVSNLLQVKADKTAGGYAGNLISGSTLNVDTNQASDRGLVKGLLDGIIKTPSSLASVLDATVSTVRNAHVSALNSDWGFTVDGVTEQADKSSYALLAGGFVGNSEATIFGDKDLDDNDISVSVNGLRGVSGGEYAGGFFGLADINGVADVADQTEIAGLINAGNISVIDAFKTYVYHGSVTGVPEGYIVNAHEGDDSGIMRVKRATGCAGGFGGGLMNGTVTYSKAKNVNAISGINYVGGFIGHMGKSGIVTVDDAELGTDTNVTHGSGTLSNLLGANVGVLNIFGAHAENCKVIGIEDGYTVSARDGTDQIAAGFAGYADLSRILNSSADNLKYVKSDGIAAGFVGKTTMAYLASVEVNGKITDLVVILVNGLLEILQAETLENMDLVNIGNKYSNSLLGLKLFADGDLLYVNLLGLKVGVSLSKEDPEYGGKDAAIVTIGDSTIKLPVTENGKVDTSNANIQIDLIKGNRTKVVNSYVKGVPHGYDVYGGGATYDADGTKSEGYAGGFVGYNKEGKFQNCEMILCDTVRGTANKVGPFSGLSTIKTVYTNISNLQEMEGSDTDDDTHQTVWNVYHVYRTLDEAVTGITVGNATINGDKIVRDLTTPYTAMNRYDINHLEQVTSYNQWENAKNSQGQDLDVYVSSAKAVLMDDTPLSANIDSLTGKPTDMEDPCIKVVDLTITKKWDDGSGLILGINQARPDHIMVHLQQSLVDENGKPASVEGYPRDILTESDVVRKVTRTDATSLLTATTATSETETDGIQMTADDQQSQFSVNTWQIVLEGLPATMVQGTQTLYYTYTISEDPVTNYETEYETDTTGRVDGDGYKFTITNKYTQKFGPPLPSTGGRGVAIFILAGMLIVALGMMVKTKRDETDPETGGEPGA